MRALITRSSGQIGTNLIGRARALLRWEPRVPLADGMPRSVAWFQEHRADHPEEDQAVGLENAEIGWKAYAAGGPAS